MLMRKLAETTVEAELFHAPMQGQEAASMHAAFPQAKQIANSGSLANGHTTPD